MSKKENKEVLEAATEVGFTAIEQAGKVGVEKEKTDRKIGEKRYDSATDVTKYVTGDKRMTSEDKRDTFQTISDNNSEVEKRRIDRNAEIAKELNVKTEEVDMALDAIMDTVSLNEPVYHDGGDAVYVMDQVKDEKNTDEKWIDDISLSEAIKKLPQREQNIISLRFFNGKTQMEIAEEIGISQAQVSRLEKNAITHMKKYL